MCRRKRNRCEILGADPSMWSHFEPLAPDKSLIDSFPHFERAVRAAANGAIEAARQELAQVQGDAIKTWYIEHAQISGKCRFAAMGGKEAGPYTGDIDLLAYPRAAVVTAVYEADGYRCRYCQRPVVHRDLLWGLQAVVGVRDFPIGPTNLATHGSVIAHRAVAEHVVPRKRGGRTEPDNLVTACYPCNFGKAHYTLKEIGLAPPRPPVRDGWVGLRDLIPAGVALILITPPARPCEVAGA
jgi:hypothetical protein